MSSMVANRAIQNSTDNQTKTFQRLSSGDRITEAADDPAGLSISSNLKTQIRSLGQAERNANDGISFAQVAEGGLSEIGNIMVRLRELGVQAASDTVGDKERGFINQEGQSLLQEVDRIANTTEFDGTPLLNGKSKKDILQIQVGIHGSESDRISFNARENDVRTDSLGIKGLNFENIDDARDSLDKLDGGLDKVSAARARLGATQSKMHSVINNIGVSKENLSAANSRIADADIAQESSNLARGNILQSAGVAVLAQANQSPAQALKLL
jgi:flagellin